MLSKIKKNYFLYISIFLMLYFIFSLLNGERGLFSYFKKNKILKDLKNEEMQLSLKINKLEIKNSLLTDNLDLDYVEFLIRDKFLLGKKNETVYIIKYDDN
tara:strand:- start:1133 stop:1435 length:303 start_codon:yes stop_codon:yes gene_type:complete